MYLTPLRRKTAVRRKVAVRRRAAAALAAMCLMVPTAPVAMAADAPADPAPAPEQAAQAAQAARAHIVDPQLRRDLAASLMIVGVTDFDDALAKLNEGVGGIFITSWADPKILTEPGRDIAALREQVGRDFSVSIDFEGGRVQRHADVLGDVPAPRTLAEPGNPEAVEDAAFRLGQRLRDHGITVDFAPVLDVDSAGLGIVGDRSFGTNPLDAARYSAAFARGLDRAGVGAVFKHFPGHGAASGDTHEAPAVTPPLDKLEGLDLAAYGPAFDAAPASTAVLVGHLTVPNLSSDPNLPASVDPAVYNLLRSGAYPGGRPFTGAVYTDDLTGMKAITDRFSLPDAALTAVAAGADLPLWSNGEEVPAVIDRVAEAVDQGQLPIDRLLDAASRSAAGAPLVERAKEALDAPPHPDLVPAGPGGMFRVMLVHPDGTVEEVPGAPGPAFAALFA